MSDRPSRPDADAPLAANLEDPDGFYDALIEAHAGLSAVDSEALNARLILILANHVGSQDVLKQAIAVARDDLLAAKERK